jgi:hypothetical protein
MAVREVDQTTSVRSITAAGAELLVVIYCKLADRKEGPYELTNGRETNNMTPGSRVVGYPSASR